MKENKTKQKVTVYLYIILANESNSILYVTLTIGVLMIFIKLFKFLLCIIYLVLLNK